MNNAKWMFKTLLNACGYKAEIEDIKSKEEVKEEVKEEAKEPEVKITFNEYRRIKNACASRIVCDYHDIEPARIGGCQYGSECSFENCPPNFSYYGTCANIALLNKYQDLIKHFKITVKNNIVSSDLVPLYFYCKDEDIEFARTRVALDIIKRIESNQLSLKIPKIKHLRYKRIR